MDDGYGPPAVLADDEKRYRSLSHLTRKQPDVTPGVSQSCPDGRPHHFLIDRDQVGTCWHCDEQRQYPTGWKLSERLVVLRVGVDPREHNKRKDTEMAPLSYDERKRRAARYDKNWPQIKAYLMANGRKQSLS